jgi:hypothetical protein
MQLRIPSKSLLFLLGHEIALTLLYSIASGLSLFIIQFNIFRNRCHHLFNAKLITIRLNVTF